MEYVEPGPEGLQLIVRNRERYTYFVYVPGEACFIYLGNRTRQRAVSLGRFVAGGQRLLKRLGYQPGRGVDARLGLLVFAVAVNSQNKTVETEIFAVPLAPAHGKRVVVEKELKPQIVHRIEEGGPAVQFLSTPPV